MYKPLPSWSNSQVSSSFKMIKTITWKPKWKAGSLQSQLQNSLLDVTVVPESPIQQKYGVQLKIILH